MRGITLESLAEHGFARLSVDQTYAPFANGGFPTPSGRCEFWSESLRAQGEDPLPAVVLPRESRAGNPALAARYPLALISPPARNFLNSSFANLPAFLAEERSPRLLIHPGDAAPRGIAAGATVKVHNDRGAFVASADVTSARARAWWSRVDLVAQARPRRGERQRPSPARR